MPNNNVGILYRIPAELFQILKDAAAKVLYSICQQIWKTQQWPQEWKRSVFISIPKKDNAKECSNYHTIAFFFTCQQNNAQVCKTRTSRCTSWIQKKQRNQRSNCQHLLDHEKAREFQKTIYFCFIDYAKAFDCVDYNKLWKIVEEMEYQTT